jgi:hypothetical protein
MKSFIGWAMVTLAPALACAQTPTAAPTQNAAQAQKLPIRYLDVTARNDGWVVAQTLGVSGSNEQKIVVVSYMDPTMTRTFFDIAVSFTRPPDNLPIFGVVRAPPHPTSPNPLGYEVYFNGWRIPTEDKPDASFTKPEHLSASIRSIKRLHSSASRTSAE